VIHYLTIGIVLGLSAGVAPGPLLTLVISETLQHDIKAGVRVAVAPIITDLPIILLTLFGLSKLSQFHNILGVISMAGGFFILCMGCQGIRAKGVVFEFREGETKSLTKGILANALSPHPYLFWCSVGAPLMTRAMTLNVGAPFAFIIGFYTSLIGAKIVLAIMIGKSKSFLSGNLYIYIMRFLGLILCVLAIALFYDGLKLVQIL